MILRNEWGSGNGRCLWFCGMNEVIYGSLLCFCLRIIFDLLYCYNLSLENFCECTFLIFFHPSPVRLETNSPSWPQFPWRRANAIEHQASCLHFRRTQWQGQRKNCLGWKSWQKCITQSIKNHAAFQWIPRTKFCLHPLWKQSTSHQWLKGSVFELYGNPKHKDSMNSFEAVFVPCTNDRSNLSKEFSRVELWSAIEPLCTTQGMCMATEIATSDRHVRCDAYSACDAHRAKMHAGHVQSKWCTANVASSFNRNRELLRNSFKT